MIWLSLNKICKLFDFIFFWAILGVGESLLTTQIFLAHSIVRPYPSQSHNLNQVKLFWLVNYWFGSKKRSGNIKSLEMKLTCFKPKFSRAFIWVDNQGDLSTRTWCTKSWSKHGAVPGKGSLRGKMAMFGGYFRNVPPKIDFFSEDEYTCVCNDVCVCTKMLMTIFTRYTHVVYFTHL